jgi:hypothetical protein
MFVGDACTDIFLCSLALFVAIARVMWTRGVDIEIVLSNPGSIPGDLSPTEANYGNGWYVCIRRVRCILFRSRRSHFFLDRGLAGPVSMSQRKSSSASRHSFPMLKITSCEKSWGITFAFRFCDRQGGDATTRMAIPWDCTVSLVFFVDDLFCSFALHS